MMDFSSFVVQYECQLQAANSELSVLPDLSDLYNSSTSTDQHWLMCLWEA